MKIKVLLLVALIAVVGGSVTVLLVQPGGRKAGPEPMQDGQLPAAISNYSKTFKLNTTPPLWPGTNGVTNGTKTN
jgi:hypothetical protein